MTEIRETMVDGFMCPGCYAFAQDADDVSDDEGTCDNCGYWFVVPVSVIPREV